MSWTPYDRGSVLAGRYRIVTPLGSGASARVFLADDTQMGRRVAVKVLHESLADDPAFLRRFEAEVRSAAALNHPNVMHVYDSGAVASPTGRDLPFLVMEFLGGGSLRAVLDHGPLLTPSQALVVGLDAARGLEYAHARGFVHRDIKPANLLFGEEGRLRIADFGLARAIAEAAWTEPAGILLGTAKYSAPEQAMGQPTDGRADVYSLALVLVEAVTGEVPFARDTTTATLTARLDGDLAVPRTLGRLAPVLERAGRLDRDLRPDAGELVIAFLAASEDMDRPTRIPLPGAIPADALDELVASAATDADADATTLTDAGADVLSVSADAPDITLIAAPGADRPGPLGVTAAGGTLTAARPAAVTDPVPALDDLPAAPARSSDRPPHVPAPESGGHPDEPAERRWPRVLAGLLVVLAAFGGAAYWWFEVRIPSHGVVDVTGMSLDRAEQELERQGFRVSPSYVRRDGTDPDEVVGQRPAAGEGLEEGRTVKLTVSLGNTLVTLPPLDSTMDEATVTATLAAAGLEVGARTEPYDENVPAGFLVGAGSTVTPDAGGQVPRGTAVDVIISKGPQPRVIPPGLVGQPLSTVQKVLTDLQLQVNVTPEFSDQPVDTVLRLNVNDNAEVARGTVIEIATSKGPELFPIPNVLGRTGVDATAILQAQGFGVQGITGPPFAPVVGIAPTVGEMHPRGTAVQLLTNG